MPSLLGEFSRVALELHYFLGCSPHFKQSKNKLPGTKSTKSCLCGLSLKPCSARSKAILPSFSQYQLVGFDRPTSLCLIRKSLWSRSIRGWMGEKHTYLARVHGRSLRAIPPSERGIALGCRDVGWQVIQMGACQSHNFCKRGNCVRATPLSLKSKNKHRPFISRTFLTLGFIEFSLMKGNF